MATESKEETGNGECHSPLSMIQSTYKHKERHDNGGGMFIAHNNGSWIKDNILIRCESSQALLLTTLLRTRKAHAMTHSHVR